jgi:ParB family chromosome partitioning protein
MRKKTGANSADNGNAVSTELRMIPLAELIPSPNNTRGQITESSLTGLAASIRRRGVLQAILVREIAAPKSGKAKYQIVAGERRFRAAKLAGLKEIPAQIKPMTDEDALGDQLVENLQREDVHPLDEADGFLRLREEMKLGVRDIAERVAKDARYVARRLALTNLIEEARDDLREDRITLAHALETCRLAPEIQTEALAACYETKSVLNRSANRYEYAPDKTRPARHVRHLLGWLAQNVHLNLHTAPFKLDDARLREDGLTCADCPQRSGRDKTLFADIKNGDTCLNPPCFQAKLQTFVQIRKAELDEKSGKPGALISAFYGSGVEAKGAISLDQYQVIEKKANRCEHAEQAVVVDGPEIGQVRWICRERNCKDHLGRVRESHSYSSGGPVSRNASPKDRNRRKQELFDIKVDEVVRKRVMAEAIKTWSWPLDRTHLNEAVKEFFRRIPSEHQRTIYEVFGWEKEAAAKLRFDDAAVLRKLAALGDDDLARFLMLCSFAHYGANQYGNSRVDQKPVVRLSQERGVNHTLIDAQVRAELSPKKYKAAHDAYLEAVENGKAAKKPVVYEQIPPAASATRTGDEKEQAAGKARSKAATN